MYTVSEQSLRYWARSQVASNRDFGSGSVLAALKRTMQAGSRRSLTSPVITMPFAYSSGEGSIQLTPAVVRSRSSSVGASPGPSPPGAAGPTRPSPRPPAGAAARAGSTAPRRHPPEWGRTPREPAGPGALPGSRIPTRMGLASRQAGVRPVRRWLVIPCQAPACRSWSTGGQRRKDGATGLRARRNSTPPRKASPAPACASYRPSRAPARYRALFHRGKPATRAASRPDSTEHRSRPDRAPAVAPPPGRRAPSSRAAPSPPRPAGAGAGRIGRRARSPRWRGAGLAPKMGVDVARTETIAAHPWRGEEAQPHRFGKQLTVSGHTRRVGHFKPSPFKPLLWSCWYGSRVEH